MNWQPIETAPTNEVVLIFIPNTTNFDPGVHRAMKLDMGTGACWQTNSLHGGSDIDPFYAPTHWMPLPEPPKDDAELAKGARP